MVHMKAPSVLFNFPYPKIWIRILRYEFTNFYEFWCRPRSPCLNSGYRNQILRYFWANFKFTIWTLRLPNMSIAYAQKVSPEQPFSAEDRFWQSISAGVWKAPTSSPLCAVLIHIVSALAVCVAPAGNKEQTQIASAQTTALVFELCASEMHLLSWRKDLSFTQIDS